MLFSCSVVGAESIALSVIRSWLDAFGACIHKLPNHNTLTAPTDLLVSDKFPKSDMMMFSTSATKRIQGALQFAPSKKVKVDSVTATSLTKAGDSRALPTSARSANAQRQAAGTVDNVNATVSQVGASKAAAPKAKSSGKAKAKGRPKGSVAVSKAKAKKQPAAPSIPRTAGLLCSVKCRFKLLVSVVNC